MTPERWQQVARVYQSAMEQEPATRGAYLNSVCGDDAELRREVESLLAQPSAPGLIDRPLVDVAAHAFEIATNLAPGTMIGSYRIVGLIGEGGMGQVYRAQDTKLPREVALKILPDAFVHDPDRLARFRQEAHVLASLNHPNIATIHGFEDSGSVHALVLELVEGPTLADRIARGPLPVDEALAIAKQIVEALEAAHERGIIHRDLKPANIKVRDDGTVKVLDFGLAKALEPAIPTARNASLSPTITSPALMTGIGMLLGTAAYMSPEQARGKPVDKRSDIWAFGCVFFEMLTGNRAFEGEDVSMTLSKVLQREPDFELFPADVPARVRQTIRLCVRKPLKERMPDMGSVRLALDGEFETPLPPALVLPRWRVAIPLALAAIIAALVTGLVAWNRWPIVEPRAVNRFEYTVPYNQVFTSTGRPVVALSPDGRQFLYNTTTGLYLRSMGALEARLIPGTGAAGVTNPFFSPDGESIAYFEGAGAGQGQLKRISIDGGAAVSICPATNPFGATWTADNTILFGQPTGIMRVSANGGTPELVIPAKKGEQVYGPQLLPDGESVLFSVTTGTGLTRWDQGEIVVQSLRTGKRTVVLHGGSDAHYVSTAHLVYALGNALLAVAFDADRLQIKGGPVSVVDGVARAANQALNTAAANYGVSDGGTLVYLAAGANLIGFGVGGGAAQASTLVWVDRKGREEALTAPPRAYTYPRISPDGSRVALDNRDQELDIWIWDFKRQTMTRFTFDPGLDVIPVWTPDGRRLIWASARGGVAPNLYWQSSDGTGAVERLTTSPNSQRPSGFAPNSKQLIFAETDVVGRTDSDLAVLPVEGDRRATRLMQTPFAEQNGEISPDGRWLAYESNESGQFQIYVRPFPAVDQGRWQVSTNGGRQPAWARSGRELFYVTSDGTLMGMPVESAATSTRFEMGTAVKLVNGVGYYSAQGTGNLGRTYDVSPDGTRFLRIKVKTGNPDESASQNHLIVVQNWDQELKQRVPTK